MDVPVGILLGKMVTRFSKMLMSLNLWGIRTYVIRTYVIRNNDRERK